MDSVTRGAGLMQREPSLRIDSGSADHARRGERLTLADWLSLSRVPLGMLFPFVTGRPVVALALLFVGGVTDVLDGWVARRQRPAGDVRAHRGDWLDPLCDKIFVAGTMLGIFLAHRPAASLLLLVLAREALQAVAFAIFKGIPALRRRDYVYRAHPLGKATTVAQFCTAILLVGGRGPAWAMAWATALLGVTSVGIYIHRALRPSPARP